MSGHLNAFNAVVRQGLQLLAILFVLSVSAAATTLPDTAPIPIPSPHSGQLTEVGEERIDHSNDAIAPASAPMPATERRCRQRLRALGATFAEAEAISEPEGCLLAHPLVLVDLGADLALEPRATLNCATAEATVRFAREVLVPQARLHFGASLVGVGHGSGYVCRTRNGTGRLSEHAFGNAIDLSSFQLADGRVILTEATSDRARRRFLRAIRGEACGRFTTVLGPGSDADHADHLHLDLAERASGEPLCR